MTFELIRLAEAFLAITDSTTRGEALGIYVWIAALLLLLVGLTMVFVKAGKHWYACWIPVYAELTLLQIVDKPKWWLVLLLLPVDIYLGIVGPSLESLLSFIGGVAQLVLFVHLIGRFGKGLGYYLGVVFLPFIFIPILGFGPAPYKLPFKRDEARRGKAKTPVQEEK